MLTGEASPTESEPAGECCEACAAASAAAHADVPDAAPEPEAAPDPGTAPDAGALPVPGPAPAPFRGALPVLGGGARPGVGIARSVDRRIAFAGLMVSAAYLGLAAASLLLPPAIRLGTWLPAHLALAGAATTAIAAVLPFFTAALVVAQPVRPAIRVAGIGLVAGGALAVMTVYGHAAGEALPAALAGGSFIAGIGFVAVAALAPLRRALGPRRALVERAYALALVNVAVGATVATFLVGGDAAVGEAWGSLKPAHAWLNLVGFAGLVIVASLLHLAPTVAGTRMRPRASGRIAVVGVAIGAPVVALGYALQVDAAVRLGAILVLAAAAGVVAHGVRIHLDTERGRWTTDAGWHQLTAGALLAGQAWLGIGLGIAAARALATGAGPAGWSLAVLIGPLVVGGVAQVLVGAMTHLLPAIGPGDPLRHAAQRRLLGARAVFRLVLLNAGALLVTAGSGPLAAGPGAAGGAPGSPAGLPLVAIGLGLAAAGLASSLALLGLAAVRRPASRRPAGLAGG
ncbi:MAG TPA: hypothetical protein VFV53_08270 [Candidatus Limnocylindrales bacterium]|nr:hypothetical protein [Candidatus Limnocylindrales bacterium]